VHPAEGADCLVRLHGKGGAGAATYESGGATVIAPSGNAAGWGGREWLYFPESSYVQARAIVANAIDTNGCGRVIIDGFSNGAAFAAKLYCRGETFGGRVVGVVVDDPVPDHAGQGCAPARSVRVTLYWTGALKDTAVAGWNCAEGDWTCEGGTTIGIDAYQTALGTTRRQSIHSDHNWYQGAPETTAF